MQIIAETQHHKIKRYGNGNYLISTGIGDNDNGKLVQGDKARELEAELNALFAITIYKNILDPMIDRVCKQYV